MPAPNREVIQSTRNMKNPATVDPSAGVTSRELLAKGTANRFPIIVAEWPRNSRELVRIALDRFNNRYTIDIRNWWRDADGTFKPSPRGLTLGVEHLPKLADAFQSAFQCAETLGLVEGPRRSRTRPRPNDSADIGRAITA